MSSCAEVKPQLGLMQGVGNNPNEVEGDPMTSADSGPLPPQVVAAFGPPDERARTLLRTHGFRCTSQRVALLVELIRKPAPGHLSITDLHHRIRAGGHAVDYTTVYRAVAVLTAAGVLHALAAPESPTTYGLTHRPHHHAVCNACGQVTEIPADRLSGALTRARKASMLALSASGSLTLNGLCTSCAATTAPESDTGADVATKG